jgi:hypothetical protein
MTEYDDLPPSTRAEKLIEEVLSEIMPLMRQRFDEVAHKPVSGSALDQAGLIDGDEIIRELCNHREWQLALEHLCYMIQEPSLPISAHMYACLEAAGNILMFPPGFLLKYGIVGPS